MTLIVKPCKFRDIAENYNFKDLCDEYGNSGEASINGLPIKVNTEHYYKMENAEFLTSVGAFLDNKLIGFVLMQTSVFPHHSRKISVIDAIYVQKDSRNTGAGLALMQQAEDLAECYGSSGIIYSSPIDGSLDKILTKKKYGAIRKLFYKSFK